MPSLSFHLLCLALLCGAALPLNAAESNLPDAVTAPAGTPVTFAPADGNRFERVLASQTSTSENGRPVNLAEIRTRVNERWEQSDGQWLLHCTPVETSVQDSSGRLLAAIQQVILEQPYTVVFDAQGAVVAVRGFDDITPKLKAALPEDIQEQVAAIFTADALRARVANSQNYQFGWLFGRQWQAGQQHSALLDLQPALGWPAQVSQTSTVTAVDASVLILNFENDDTLPTPDNIFSIHLSEKGTATLDSASGQLQLLQKSRLARTQFANQQGDTITIEETEVITTTWTKAGQIR